MITHDGPEALPPCSLGTYRPTHWPAERERDVSTRLLEITTAEFGKGAYCVRVSDGANHRIRTLVIE